MDNLTHLILFIPKTKQDLRFQSFLSVQILPGTVRALKLKLKDGFSRVTCYRVTGLPKPVFQIPCEEVFVGEIPCEEVFVGEVKLGGSKHLLTKYDWRILEDYRENAPWKIHMLSLRVMEVWLRWFSFSIEDFSPCYKVGPISWAISCNLKS